MADLSFTKKVWAGDPSSSPVTSDDGNRWENGIATALQQLLSTPLRAIWNGSAYVYLGSSTPVSAASRTNGRPITFLGGPDPANLNIGLADGDDWKDAA